MLCTRIAALRRQAGLSQAALAARLGVSPSAVGMYEQGRREPSAELLVAMGEVFGVSTDYLLTGQARQDTDRAAMAQALLGAIAGADRQLEARRDRPFSRQELAVLMAALLLEP